MAILESARRLSQSSLWQLQRRYFDAAGRDAFSTATVPHYITNNAHLAAAYAQLVVGFVIDRRAELRGDAPLYIVELGAGSGRFAFQFLERFTALLATAGLDSVRFTYVLTDFTDAGFATIAAHEQLQRFFAAGQLDYARFDAEHDRTITLQRAGRTLVHGALGNPLVVLGNYFFDSIPIDAFVVRDHVIYEAAAALVSEDLTARLDDPAVLGKLSLQYEERVIDDAYYGDPAIDALLALYRERMAHGAVRLPIAALGVCRWLREISDDDWLLVSADKGTLDPNVFVGQRPAGMSVHGSFSINVDYHAIRTYLETFGAATFAPDHTHEGIAIVCAVARGAARPMPALRAAYAATIAEFGPDDYFVLRRGLEANAEALSFEMMLALFRLGRYEPRLVNAYLGVLRKQLPQATPAQKVALAVVIERAAARYFFIGERTDFAFAAGVLLSDLGLHERAIAHFHESLQRYGEDSGTCFNLAHSHLRLGRMNEARQFARRALAIDPDHAGARRVLDNIPLAE